MPLPLPHPVVHDAKIQGNLDAIAAQFPVPPRAPIFTTATLPAASVLGAGALVFVSDGGGGAQAKMSTGSAYINLG